MLLKDDGYFVGWVGKIIRLLVKLKKVVLVIKVALWITVLIIGMPVIVFKFYPKNNKRHAIFKNAKADTHIEIMEEGLENFMEPNEAFQAGYRLAK